MVRVGIIGGAGYTGGEAIRILLNHPDVELAFVHSNSNGGNRLSDVHIDLLGETDMRFTDQLRTDVDSRKTASAIVRDEEQKTPFSG